MSQISLLVPPSARAAHAELLAALGTEHVPDQWMEFMDAVTRLLPEVLSPGRPARVAIQRSLIGQLGFTSWREMIEAPTDAGGLGWNWSGWKAWRRAWATVQAYPWLRGQPMGSSEVNALQLECNRTGQPFPQSPEELAARQEQRQAAAAEQRSNSINALTSQLQAAELRATQAEAQVVALDEQLQKARAHHTEQGRALAQMAQLEEQVHKLQQQVAARQQQIDQLQKAQQVGRWQHLVAFLRGR